MSRADGTGDFEVAGAAASPGHTAWALNRMGTERLFDSTAAQLILAVAIVAIAVTVGVYVIGRVRKSSRESTPTASDHLTNFRDLHSQGELSDEEFRTIKSMLAERMQRELTDNNRKG